MSSIIIQPIIEANWLDALDLTVYPHQTQFVPTVELSLAKAYIKPNGFRYDPFGIGLRQWRGNQLIGFYSLIHLPDDPTFAYIGGFFIDRRYQGQGHGRAALQAIIQKLRVARPRSNRLLLSVHPENVVAIALYEAAAFVKTGQWLDGEAEMALALRPAIA
ncbi:MAG TPA: GNAT family N-acetyltransferase [Caldilineaceae bacterium]|nr:GNAT family N-acetyltransferase [Caldilineaceae bacterium]